MFKFLTCRSIRRSLPDYVTRRLSSAENDRIERHLAVCPDCAAARHSLSPGGCARRRGARSAAAALALRLERTASAAARRLRRYGCQRSPWTGSLARGGTA